MDKTLPIIPCELYKCILYPVCKSKDKIKCSQLGKYLKQLRDILDEHNGPLMYKSWQHIIKFLPKLESIEEQLDPTSNMYDLHIKHLKISLKPIK